MKPAYFARVGLRRDHKAQGHVSAARKAPRKPKPVQTVASMEPVMLALGVPAGQRIVCAWPPKELNPNRRIHPAKRAPFAKRYLHDCWVLALEAKLTAGAEHRIFVRLDFFPPDRVRRDDDNAISSFKAGRDGIAKAMKVDDSRFKIIPDMHAQPLGCVVVTLIDGATS